jgi:hypothetical protein
MSWRTNKGRCEVEAGLINAFLNCGNQKRKPGTGRAFNCPKTEVK